VPPSSRREIFSCSKPARIRRSAARGLFQDLDHGGGSNNSGGIVLFQGEEFLVAGHEELGLAGFSQREQIIVLGIRRDGAGGQVPAKKEKSRRPAASSSAALERSLARKNGRPATSRNSAMSTSQATSVNVLRSQASSSLAGAPRGDRSAESRMLVSRMRRIRTVWRAPGSVSRGLLRLTRQSSSGVRLGKRRRKLRGLRGRSDERCASGQPPR